MADKLPTPSIPKQVNPKPAQEAIIGKSLTNEVKKQKQHEQDLLREQQEISKTKIAKQNKKLKQARTRKELNIVKRIILAVILIFIALLIGGLIFTNFLPDNEPTEPEVLVEEPEATESAGTGVYVEDPFIQENLELELIKKEDLSIDDDGDSIPNRLEELLGYDPEANDCVRSLGCGEFPTVPQAKLEVNMLFILDASASMSETLEGVSKWESAQEALVAVMDSGLPEFANVGLIVYGHKGTASVEDRQESCDGAELVHPLASVDTEGMRSVVNEINPSGWTGLARSIELAGEILAGRELSQNFVVLLTDGKETCGGDPVKVASDLNLSGTELITNVVGFVVTPEEQEQLESIAQAGSGKYFGANSRQELQDALLLSAEAVRLWDEVNRCILDNLQGYGQCINVQYMRSINYMDRLQLYLQDVRGVLSGSDFLEKDYRDVYWEIWDKYNILRDQNWEKYDEDLKKLYPQG